MTSIGFATSEKALLRGARAIVVVAPAAALKLDEMPAIFDRRFRQEIATVAENTAPGDRGRLATTWRNRAPHLLMVGVLPNSVSRYNAPSRAEAIRHVISCTPLGERGKVAILLVLDHADHLLAAMNAVGRAVPKFSAKTDETRARIEVLAVDRSGAPVVVTPVVRATVEATRDAAELVDTPPSELTPTAFAERAREMLRGLSRVKVREIVGDKLLDHGLRAVHAVGRAATNPPRVLLATYEPERKGGRHIALVGKGITFDTGGLHIKARGFMEGMKSDMGGAAAVHGAFRVLAASGYRHRISLVLCMAENAVGPTAYKPDDILELHSGKTVEINNTDAEGRLLLADGVSWAARELRADIVIDAATLTGAQLIATGLLHAAIVSDDEELERLLVESGRHSGDLVHPLPFAPEFYRKEFDSPVADMRNSVANRNNAQSSCAAIFVHWHMADAPGRRSWCHVDLAGPAFPKDRGSGFGVALLAEALRRLE